MEKVGDFPAYFLLRHLVFRKAARTVEYMACSATLRTLRARRQADEMVAALEAAASENIGVAEIVVDGQKVRYDRAQLLEELKYWRSVQSRRYGRRPITGQVRLDGAW